MQVNKQALLDAASDFLSAGNINAFADSILDLYRYGLTCGCFFAHQPAELWVRFGSLIRNVEDDESNFNLNFSKGFICLRQGIKQEAYQYLTNAIKLRPLLDTSYSLRSYIDERYNANCLKDATEALVLSASARNYFVLAGIVSDTACGSGDDYFLRTVSPENDKLYQQSTEKAIALYENALALNRGFECAYYNMGLMHRRLGSYAKAAEAFLNCVRIEPTHWAWEALWGCLEESGATSDYQSAMELITSAMASNSENKQLLLELSFAHSGLNDYKKALELNKEYLTYIPQDERGIYRCKQLKNIMFQKFKSEAIVAYQESDYALALAFFNAYFQERSSAAFKTYSDDPHGRLNSDELEIYLETILRLHSANVLFGEEHPFYKEMQTLRSDYGKKLIAGITQSEDERNARKLTRYEYSYKIGFGAHAGKTVLDVLKLDSRDLLQCIVNLRHFAISNGLLTSKLFIRNNDYYKAVEINLVKNKLIEKWAPKPIEDEDEDDYDNGYSSRDYDRDNFYALTGGQMGDWDDFGGDMDDARSYMGLD